tara:strand:+ start:119 stop:634 length:516 start_codon:yes stop_codon:yes gene_type:complete
MPFVRIKKISNKEYAYLVENTWKKRKKSSRQKSLKYLGRVFRLEKANELNYVFDEALDFKKAVLDLIKSELKCFSFIGEDKLKNEDLIVDFSNHKVYSEKNNKEITIKMNEGYFNSYSLKKVLSFTPEGDMNEIAFSLANSFVAAGIDIPKDIFINLYHKLVEEHNLSLED